MPHFIQIVKTVCCLFTLFSAISTNDDHESEVNVCTYLPEGNITLQKDDVNILKSGLKEKNVNGHVVIIGAGISGLTAAMLLEDAGIKVKILEASERIGGRIQTSHHNNPDFYAEFGAMRYPTTHIFWKPLFEMLNITTVPFSYKTNFYYISGERINGKLGPTEWEQLSKLYGLKNKLSVSPWSILTKDFEVAWNIVKEKGWNDALKFLDTYSVEGWHMEQRNMSEDGRSIVDMLAVIGNFEAFSSTSFVEGLRYECALGANSHYRQVDGGSSKIPREIVEQKLKQTKIYFNKRVVRIDQTGKQIEVKFICDSDGINCEGGSGKVLTDYVISTASAGATLRLEFKPPLDRKITHALRKVHYDNAVKIFLVFKRPFWEDEGIFGGKIISDLPIRATYFVEKKFPSGVGVMISSYTWGDDAKYWSGMGEKEAVATSLEMVTKILGVIAKEEFLEGFFKDWMKDKYALGAYALFNPHQAYLQPSLEMPTDRVSFAGDHTAEPHGWIENCIRSAIRASEETIAGLKSIK